MMKISIIFCCILICFNAATAQQTTSSGLTVTGQQSVDGKQYKILNGRHIPYASAAEFLAYVVATRRHVGEIAYVYNGLAIETWQFVGGIADVNFVKATGGGGITELKTINNVSLLGTGNIALSNGGPFAEIDLTGIAVNDFVKWDGTKFIKTAAPTGGGSSNVIQVIGNGTPASGNIWIDSTNRSLNYLFGNYRYRLAKLDSTALVVTPPPPSGTYDVDAQALFTAAGTTGDNYKTAVNNAIVALKGITLAAGGTAWSKSLMVNGRAGSTLAEQAVNWKTPGTYNYTYFNGIVYNANGTKFDGISQYINTNLNTSIAFAGIGLSDITMVSVIGQYPSSAINQNTYSVPGPSNILAQPSQAGGYTSYLSEGGIVAANPLGTVGRYINTYTAPNNVRLYRNGTQIGFEVFTPTAVFPNNILYEGANKFGVDFVNFTQARIDVTQIITSKLTAGEVASIDAVWASYESALSR